MSMSNISIVGNLARAPEQICFASGRVKTVLIVAVNPAKQVDKNEAPPPADFYRVETWGRLAELAQKYLNKGNQIGISGRLNMEHWTDREGRDKITPVVAATQLSFPPKMSKAREAISGASSDKDDDFDDGSDLFEGARAITVAEPPPHYYRARKPKLKMANVS